MTDFVKLADVEETIRLVGPLPALNGTQDEPEHDSWAPQDLTGLPDKPPIRPTLGHVGIVYPGKRHVFSGPPESAKTLAAYAILINVVRTGDTAILIDFEMGSYDTRDRLRELGATTPEIQRVHYIEPDAPATPERINRLIDYQPQLVVIDAAAGAYDLEGLDDNKRQDVEKLSRLYVRSFWKKGIASIFVDHVVKNTETRGKFAIGSERKLGGADVHLGFETQVPISRGTSGHYKIITHKDRGGYLKRGKLADLELSSDPDTNQIEWTFYAATEDQDAPFRPTHLMERVSVYLETSPGEHSRNEIAKAVKGEKKALLAAVNALVSEGYAAGESPKPVIHSRRYREQDPACNPENTQPVRVVLGGSSVVREPGAAGGSGGSLFPKGSDTTPEPLCGPSEPPSGSWLDDLIAEHDLDLQIEPGTLDDEPTRGTADVPMTTPSS